MVSLEQPRALAAGAINPLDSSRAFIICSCVYLRYGRLGLSTLTSSVMRSFFLVAKVSNVLINSDCSTPYVRAMSSFLLSIGRSDAPTHQHLDPLLFAVVVSAHALPPQLVFFIAVSLARAPFNEPV